MFNEGIYQLRSVYFVFVPNAKFRYYILFGYGKIFSFLMFSHLYESPCTLQSKLFLKYRSSRQEIFYKNYSAELCKSSGKNVFWSLLFNKVTGLLFLFTDWILEYTFHILYCFHIFYCFVTVPYTLLFRFVRFVTVSLRFWNSAKLPWWSFFAEIVTGLYHKC